MLDSPDQARFRVDRLVKLPGRPGVFLCGEIIEGTARVGMTVQLPLTGDVDVRPLAIRAIEFLDRPSGAAEMTLNILFVEREEMHEMILDGQVASGVVVTLRSVSSAGQRSEE